MEGLFEATPQSLIFCFAIMRGYWECEQTNALKVASLCLAFSSSAATLATVGDSAQLAWRVAFGLFCLVQIVLRSVRCPHLPRLHPVRYTY